VREEEGGSELAVMKLAYSTTMLMGMHRTTSLREGFVQDVSRQVAEGMEDGGEGIVR
jgi:hypothetical protein